MTDHVMRSFHTAVAAGLVPILAEFWSSYEWMFKETTPEFHVPTNGDHAIQLDNLGGRLIIRRTLTWQRYKVQLAYYKSGTMTHNRAFWGEDYKSGVSQGEVYLLEQFVSNIGMHYLNEDIAFYGAVL